MNLQKFEIQKEFESIHFCNLDAEYFPIDAVWLSFLLA